LPGETPELLEVRLATPLPFSATVANVLPFAEKETVPVGVPPEEETVAFSVTEPGGVTEVGLTTRAVAVLETAFRVTATAGETLVSSAESPPYCALTEYLPGTRPVVEADRVATPELFSFAVPIVKP
jgi:hypothetical protein